MPDHWASYVVVHRQWKYMQNKDGSHVELYDLQKDPLEKIQVEHEYPEETKQCQQQLKQWLDSLPTEPTGNIFSSLRANLKK